MALSYVENNTAFTDKELEIIKEPLVSGSISRSKGLNNKGFESFGIDNRIYKIPVDSREKLQDGYIVVKLLMNFKLPVFRRIMNQVEVIFQSAIPLQQAEGNSGS